MMYDREQRAGNGGRGIRAMLGGLVLLLALAVPAAAQEPALTPEQTRTANEAMAQLRSPVTPFHTVDMCPSVPAMRDSIRVMAAAGWDREQIVEDFIARHGEQIRLLPKSRGAGLWAWVATPLVILLGAGLIIARLTSDRRKAPPAPVVSSLSEGERDRLAAAMRQWEDSGEVEP